MMFERQLDVGSRYLFRLICTLHIAFNHQQMSTSVSERVKNNYIDFSSSFDPNPKVSTNNLKIQLYQIL